MNTKPYQLLNDIEYYSERYNRWIFVPAGRWSDGATFAKDLTGPIDCLKYGEPFKASLSWWVHDEPCMTGKWSEKVDGVWMDGAPITNWQLSWVLRDILKAEGHSFRMYTWLLFTFLLGGGKAQENTL